jgi:iron complex transport system substrate-binding protein
MLAGCAGGSGSGDSNGTNGSGGSNGTNGSDGSNATAGNGTGEPNETEAGNESTGGGGYSVSMEPVGTVEFDAVPETVAVYCPGYADMAVALGHADAVASVGLPSRYHTEYYQQLDGVSIDKGSLTTLVTEGIDKEVFYEIDADVHTIDPNWLRNNFDGWTEADVTEIREQVAPFLGNTIFRRTDEWHDYRYYTMYEAFEKMAALYQERERYEAFASFHDEFLGRIQGTLPEASERPNALLCFAAGDEPEAFSPYRLTDRGTNKKQFHDLGIEDALGGSGVKGLSTNDRGQIDYETMLEVDPESILVRGHEDKSPEEFRNTVLAFMEQHPVASDLTAVEQGQVYRGGPIYEGPIQNLFLTERYAKLYFPDAVGDGELFDRGTLAGIVTG